MAVSVCCKSKEFDIDLDLPPQDRYLHVLPHYRLDLTPFLVKFNSHLPRVVRGFLKFTFSAIVSAMYHEYAEEIVGIAHALNVSSGEVFVANFVYELLALCTSIVARDSAGRVVLGRNLDFLFVELLRNLHVVFRYRHGPKGKVLFQCSGLAGFVGSLTCMKPGKFAISLNMRAIVSLADTIKCLVLGRPLVTWMIRDTLTHARSYDEALKMLRHARCISGSYIILSGVRTNEGAVLTMGREGAIDVRELNDSNWFLAQCNHDPWDANDTRSIHARLYMERLGQNNLDLRRLARDVLMRGPLLRRDTVVTVLMSPSDDRMYAVVPETAAGKEKEEGDHVHSLQN